MTNLTIATNDYGGSALVGAANPIPVTLAGSLGPSVPPAGAQGAVTKGTADGTSLALSGTGSALNAVLWDTGTDGALPYTIGLVQSLVNATATAQIQGTNDDGVTWLPLILDREDTSTSPSGSGFTPTATGAYRFNTSGWARVRCIITSYTSGTVVANAVLNAGPENPNRTPLPLATGSNQLGSVISGAPYQDSLTPLGAAGSFSGSARDIGTTTGANAIRSYFTGSFFADQAGTAFIEGSWDGATYYPRNGTAGTALAAGQTLDIKVPGTFRYNRVRYVNGATLQTKFSATSMYSQS